MSKFIFKFCGRGVESPHLVGNDCSRSPNNRIHEWIDGTKSKYTCKYCGRVFNKGSSGVLMNADCPKSPNQKYHELM